MFDAVLFTGDILLGLFSVVLAFKTKKHLPADKKYRKYHESAVINLSTMMALFLSTVCEAVLILFLLNGIQNGTLLIIALRECFWLYPVTILLFVPKVRILCFINVSYAAYTAVLIIYTYIVYNHCRCIGYIVRYCAPEKSLEAHNNHLK